MLSQERCFSRNYRAKRRGYPEGCHLDRDNGGDETITIILPRGSRDPLSANDSINQRVSLNLTLDPRIPTTAPG